MTNHIVNDKTIQECDSVNARILKARRSQNMHKHTKLTKVADIVVEDLKRKGAFYRFDSWLYYFNGTTGSLIEIEEGSIPTRILLSQYGLNGTEDFYRFTEEHIIVHGLLNGTETRILNGPYYDIRKQCLYVSVGHGKILQIFSHQVREVGNGSDGILFLSRSSLEMFAWKRIPRAAIEDTIFFREIFSSLNFDKDSVLTKSQATLLILIWFFSLFFGSIQSTRVILAQIGPKGSGKTMLLRAILRLLFGSKSNVTPMQSTQRDLETILTTNYFAFLDNVDDPGVRSGSRWICDLLAVASTGGNIKRRKLYTTNEVGDFPIDCFLALTSRTPSFRRDDVADRLLVFNYERRTSFQSESEVLKRIEQKRSEILSEVVVELQHIIASFCKDDSPPYSGQFRIADFAQFALKVGRAWNREDEVKTALDNMIASQSAFTLEESPIFQALNIWVDVAGNSAKEISSKDLRYDLAQVATWNGIEQEDFVSTQIFAQRLSQLRPNLQSYFDIIYHEHGSNRRTYSISRIKVKGVKGASNESNKES